MSDFRLAPSPHPTGGPPGVTYVEVRPGVFAHPDDADRYRASLASAGIPHVMAPTPAPDKPDIKITREPPPDHKPTPVPFKPPPLPRPADITRPDIKPPALPKPPDIEPPTPAPPVPKTPVPADLARLDRFRTEGGYDLIQVMQAAVNKPELRNIAAAYFDMTAVRQAEILAKPGIPVEDWEKLSPERQKMLRPVRDVTASEFARLSDWERLYVRNIEADRVSPEVYAKLGPAARKNVVPELGIWARVTPWREELGETASAAGVGRLAAELMVPGVYTGTHWKDLSPAQKGLGITLDIASFIPGISILSASRRAGMTLSQALKTTAIAEARAPVDMALRPVEALKSWTRAAETAIHPRRIPLAAAEIRSHTVKLPVRDFPGPETAMAARDELVRQAVQGSGPVVTVAGREIALTPSSLQRIVGGAAVHSTPDIRPFLHGTTVQAGREGGLYIAPNVHTRFTRSSAFGDLPTGGIPGGIIVTDRKILARLEPSRKIYRRQVEMEELIPARVDLPAPRQVIRMRDIDGTDLHFLVIGEPLSKAQIAKLKFIGPVDTVRAIFRPAYTVRAAHMDNLEALGRQARTLETQLAAAKRAKDTVQTRRLSAELRDIDRRARVEARRIETAFRGRPLHPVGLSKEEFMLDGVYRDYAAADPRGFARWVRGLPPDEQTRVFDALPPASRRALQTEVARTTTAVRRYVPGPEVARRIPSTAAITTVPRVTRPPDEPRVPRVPARPPDDPRVPRRPGRPPDEPRIPRLPRRPPDEPRIPKIPVVVRRRSDDLEIKRVEGIPHNPGIIEWDQGIVRIRMVPPFREGTEDITYTPRVPPARGRHTPETSLEVFEGDPPRLVTVRMGVTEVDIVKGQKMHWGRRGAARTRAPRRTPRVMQPGGKIDPVIRGTII